MYKVALMYVFIRSFFIICTWCIAPSLEVQDITLNEY